jgi:hypothetical protein
LSLFLNFGRKGSYPFVCPVGRSSITREGDRDARASKGF